MAYIDPWKGMTEGADDLYKMGLAAVAQRRQEELDRMAKEDWTLAHAAKQQAWDDEQAKRVAEAEWRKGKANPNYMSEDAQMQSLATAVNPPQYSPIEAGLGRDMADAGLAEPQGTRISPEVSQADLRSAVSPEMAQTQVPFSPAELAQKRSELLAGQGKFTEAEDITHKFNTGQLERIKLMGSVAGSVIAKMGNTPEGKQAAANAVMMAGGTREEAQGVMNTDWGTNGMAFIKAPNGGTVTVDLTGALPKLELHNPVKPTAQKYYGMPVVETLNGKQQKGQYAFNTPEELAAYERTGIPKGGNWESNFGSKDTTVVVSPTAGIPREIAQGPVMTGPYKGQTAYKNSKGGAPFVYNKDGTTTSVAGYPIDTKSAAAAYVTTQDETTGLTPGEEKANLKAKQDPTSMRVVKRIDGVVPVLEKLSREFATLPNETGIVPLNKVLRTANVMIGNTKIDSYETFIKEATREVQSALSGNQSSQTLVLQQIDVLKSAKTNAQRIASINAIITTLQERRKAELSAPFQPKGGQKGQLDATTAKTYLAKAKGDKAKARELAKADGWSF